MTDLIIYNDSPYFYHISKVIYHVFNSYLDVQLVNMEQNYKMLDNKLYLLFIPSKTLPKKYIVYNFEQFTTKKEWPSTYIDFLKNALYVIDYSINNMFKFEEMKINTYYLPYMPFGLHRHPKLDDIEKDIDVLFIGNMNRRRSRWLNSIQNKKYNVKFVNKTFMDESLDYFARSKIVVNIHYYDGDTILEVSRIIPALENNCIVISEKSNDDIYNIMYKNVIKIIDEVELNNSIEKILSNYHFYLEESKKYFSEIPLQIISNNVNELVKLIKLI